MDIHAESCVPDDLRRTSQTQQRSRVWIASAQRVISRSKELCEAIHERRRHPDFFDRLARHALASPWMQRFLPLTGAASQPFLIHTEDRPEGIVAHVAGEVDLANVDHFKGAIEPAVRDRRNVILDVSNLKYIDSTGLHALIAVQQGLQQHNRRLVVVGASPMIAKLMRIVGFDGLMPLVPSMEGAKELLR